MNAKNKEDQNNDSVPIPFCKEKAEKEWIKNLEKLTLDEVNQLWYLMFDWQGV